MCLVAIAWQVHPRYPLVLVGNRDERHARPTASADWWPDLPAGVPPVVGGRDLQAGGSWLGLSRSGRLAVVTNHPGRQAAAVPAPSRGALVRDFLISRHDVEPFIDELAERASRYAGFSLVVATPAGAGLVVADDGPVHRGTLAPGIHVFSNSGRAAPWPKTGWLADRLGDLLATADGVTTTGQLLDLLLHRGPVGATGDTAESAGARLPAVSRQPFVMGTDYGTRSTTAILMESSGQYHFSERRFGPEGRSDGESHFAFSYQGAGKLPTPL